MKLIRNIAQMHRWSVLQRKRNLTIGFVPTMGALHEGHLSLIRRARRENDSVAVSIFVNPAQFGPHEDFKKYPRNLFRDASLCRAERVDVLFVPSAASVYPAGYKTYVTVEGFSEVLCGRSRPGHFRGVATVVNKLFNVISPDRAYFGQKDAQQAAIIKKMVRDLNMPVTVKVLATVREPDGLALSSRNAYLNAGERADALVLWQALCLARRMAKRGVRDTAQIIREMKRIISQKSNSRIDYVEVVDASTFLPLREIRRGALAVLAVWIGKTRLIDNMVLRPGGEYAKG